MVARAHERAAARAVEKDPACWGVSPTILMLPTSDGTVSLNRDPQQRGRVLSAKRSDAFQLVTLTADQERAADWHWTRWCERAGIRAEDWRPAMDLVDRSPGLAPGQNATQRMIDAGVRLDEAYRAAGPVSAALLRALVEPLVMHGEVRAWRGVVERLTGEKERHAQAAAVRAACENLARVYEDVDEAYFSGRKDRAG